MKIELQTRDNQLLVSAVIEANDSVTVGSEYHQLFPLNSIGVEPQEDFNEVDLTDFDEDDSFPAEEVTAEEEEESN